MPGIAVFLSYPKPALKRQAAFVDRVVDHLADRGFEARTLGVTDYDMQAPLTAIRRLMLESGVVASTCPSSTSTSIPTACESAEVLDRDTAPWRVCCDRW